MNWFGRLFRSAPLEPVPDLRKMPVSDPSSSIHIGPPFESFPPAPPPDPQWSGGRLSPNRALFLLTHAAATADEHSPNNITRDQALAMARLIDLLEAVDERRAAIANLDGEAEAHTICRKVCELVLVKQKLAMAEDIVRSQFPQAR